MIGIFVNTTAGKGRASKLASQLEKALADKDIAYQSFMDDWPDNTGDVTEAWVVGGDGTLNYFINKYREISIPVAIFKGGTGNDFAWKLYGNLSTKEQIETILQATHKPVDAALCNDKIFINGVGIGFDGEVLQSMGTIRLFGGHLGYLWIVIRKIFSFREQVFSIRSNDRHLHEKFLLVNIANSPRTGGGFMVSPLAEINDSRLNMMLCRPLPLLKRLKYLPVIEKGKHLSLPFILHHFLEHTVIECETETPAQLDGELIWSKKFQIRIMPGHLLFKY